MTWEKKKRLLAFWMPFNRTGDLCPANRPMGGSKGMETNADNHNMSGSRCYVSVSLRICLYHWRPSEIS